MPPISKWLPFLFVAALALLLNHFLASLAWAGLLAVITWPIHENLLKKGFSAGVSAAILVGAIVLVFGAPLVLLINTLGQELSSLHTLLTQISHTGLPPPSWLHKLPLGSEAALSWWKNTLAAPGSLNIFVKATLEGLAPHLTSTAGALGAMLLAKALYIFLALLTLSILYLHGDAVIQYVDHAGRRLYPDGYVVARKLFPLSVRGTAVGLGSVALLEGTVLGIAYAIAGAPLPALLGIITGYLALIPGGAPLSFTTVSLLLLGQGHASAALGLFCWGAFELFMVDKFIRPKLIGHRVELPFLAVLFGLLGGVSTIGVLGLFVGPFMMAILFWWLRQSNTPAK